MDRKGWNQWPSGRWLRTHAVCDRDSLRYSCGDDTGDWLHHNTTQQHNTTTSSFERSGSLTLLKDAPSLHSPLSLSCRVSSLNTLRPAWGVKAFKHKHKPDTQTQPCSHRSALQETKAGARMKCSHCHHPNTSAKITDLRSCVKHSPQREFTKKP